MAELRSTTQLSHFAMLFSCWATISDPDQPIRKFFSVVRLRSTTQINQFAMFFQWLIYDIRHRSTNSQCFFSGWATIYDKYKTNRNVILVVELRSTTQINHFSMFVQWLSYDVRHRSVTFVCFLSGWPSIYDPDQPICNVFSVVELRSTTKVSQVEMFFSGWATIYDPDQHICNVFEVVKLWSTTQIN